MRIEGDYDHLPLVNIEEDEDEDDVEDCIDDEEVDLRSDN